MTIAPEPLFEVVRIARVQVSAEVGDPRAALGRRRLGRIHLDHRRRRRQVVGVEVRARIGEWRMEQARVGDPDRRRRRGASSNRTPPRGSGVAAGAGAARSALLSRAHRSPRPSPSPDPGARACASNPTVPRSRPHGLHFRGVPRLQAACSASLPSARGPPRPPRASSRSTPRANRRAREGLPKRARGGSSHRSGYMRVDDARGSEHPAAPRPPRHTPTRAPGRASTRPANPTGEVRQARIPRPGEEGARSISGDAMCDTSPPRAPRARPDRRPRAGWLSRCPPLRGNPLRGFGLLRPSTCANSAPRIRLRVSTRQTA